jgi:hypothetical protein
MKDEQSQPLPLGYSLKATCRLLGDIGMTTLHTKLLDKPGGIRTFRICDRHLCDGEDVRRIAREGFGPQRKTPPVRRGDEHHRSKARRGVDSAPAEPDSEPSPAG